MNREEKVEKICRRLFSRSAGTVHESGFSETDPDKIILIQWRGELPAWEWYRDEAECFLDCCEIAGEG